MTDGTRIFYLLTFERELHRLTAERAFECVNPSSGVAIANIQDSNSAFNSHDLRIRAAATSARQAVVSLEAALENIASGSLKTDLAAALDDFT